MRIYFATLLFAILGITVVLIGRVPFPEPEPRIGMVQAIKLAEEFSESIGWAEDAYPSRAILVRDEGQDLWMVWLASPTQLFLILEVDLSGTVRKSNAERIQRFFRFVRTHTDPERPVYDSEQGAGGNAD